MNVRVRGFELFKAGLINGLKSIRSLADLTQISKSSVHRHQQAMKRRNLHPESYFWETPDGYQWLRLLVFTTVYIFGIQQGVGCEVISRFFHLLRLQNVIGVSPTSLRLNHLKKQLRTLHGQVLNYTQKRQPIPERLSQQITVLQEEYNFFFTGQQAYHDIVHQITSTVHPFAIDGSGYQSTVDAATALYQLLPQLAAVGHTYQIAKLDKAIKVFSGQIAAMAAGINLWWQSVEESLLLEEIDVEMSDWLLKYFLPHFYWRSVIAQTKNPTLRQIYESTSVEALSRLLLHPLTSKLDRDEWAHWRFWATNMSAKFQRSSSAIEGRNGYLSRLHHCGRGISQQQLQVLTVIHNFDLKRNDGTTAAQRLFAVEFPDLFEWLIVQMGDLPLPRKSYSF